MYVVHSIFIDYEQAFRLKWRVKPAAVGVTLTPNIYLSWRACWSQVPIVETLDSAIHQINHYPVDSAIDSPISFPLDSDLSRGWLYPRPYPTLNNQRLKCQLPTTRPIPPPLGG